MTGFLDGDIGGCNNPWSPLWTSEVTKPFRSLIQRLACMGQSIAEW